MFFSIEGKMVDRYVNLYFCVILFIFIIYLVILFFCDGEFYMFGYCYLCLYLEVISVMIEFDKVFCLFLSFLVVLNRRIKRVFMIC